jgi:hypothetical protein
MVYHLRFLSCFLLLTIVDEVEDDNELNEDREESASSSLSDKSKSDDLNEEEDEV